MQKPQKLPCPQCLGLSAVHLFVQPTRKPHGMAVVILRLAWSKRQRFESKVMYFLKEHRQPQIVLVVASFKEDAVEGNKMP